MELQEVPLLTLAEPADIHGAVGLIQRHLLFQAALSHSEVIACGPND
jgi:hypothetical protein